MTMRGSKVALAAIVLAAGAGGPCLGQVGAGLTHVQRCTVTSLDSMSMNFGCQGRTENRFYWATRATHIRAGGAHAAFFTLKTGQPVHVISHRAGAHDIADVVTL